MDLDKNSVDNVQHGSGSHLKMKEFAPTGVSKYSEAQLQQKQFERRMDVQNDIGSSLDEVVAFLEKQAEGDRNREKTDSSDMKSQQGSRR